jgi:tRNA-dihydrouridine synthase B
MAGITDLPFRLICKKFGAGMVYSEMVSATGLFYDGEKSKELLKTIPKEQPLAIQLFGAEPKHFAKATKIVDKILNDKVETRSRVLGTSLQNQIDINFGCPVKKVINQGAGCALMKKPKLARKIIQVVLRNTSLPVSIKIRTGIEKNNALDFLKEVADLKWKTVIIHGRTYEQGFGGPIDLELIKKIKQAHPEKNIIANGGIIKPEDAKNVLEKTGADGIAIAQGALGKPWIFQQIKDHLKTGKYSEPNIEEIKKTISNHLGLFLKHKGEENIKEFRKHLGWYFKGLSGAKNIRKKLFEIENSKDIIKILNKFNNNVETRFIAS